MAWWVWALIGLGLILAELATPAGFYLLFFGFGALAVALLASLEVTTAPWLQWLLFTIASVAGVLLLRRPLRDRLGARMPARTLDGLVGEIGTALEDIGSDAVGRVELRGTPWTARNVGSGPLVAGQRCRVRQVEGLTLWVRAE